MNSPSLNKIFAILIFLSISVQAQTEPESFGTLGIGINIDRSLDSEDGIHDFWETKTGFGLYLSTPFYAGDIAIGAKYRSFNALNSPQPDFRSLYYYFQWKEAISVFERLALGGGVNAGLFEMNFDGIEETSQELEVEREFSAGVILFAEYRFNGNLSLKISADYLSVFTRKEITLFSVGAGIEYKFESPRWLKDFLR